MNTPEAVDVVIVGAGMVGVTLAAALAPSGMRIVLLEQRPGGPEDFAEWVSGQEGHDPRVSALTCASQQILSSVGAWPFIQDQRISPYTHMDVWDGEGTGHIHFSANELHEPVLGHIVENRITLLGLYKAIEAFDNVEFLSGAEVVSVSSAEKGMRQITLGNGEELKAALVVASDGALSKTRQMMGIPMWEWDYGHHALVTTVKTAQPHQQTAWQRFTEDGPLAFLPLTDESGDHYFSIVWSTSPANAKSLMGLDDQAFCDALGEAFEHKLGVVEWSDQRHVFPLRQRHAKYYVKEGFAAIGDAAHTIHPLAGQGVNLGLLDAAQLAENVLEAYSRGEAIGSMAVLRRFQRLRRNDNLQMSAAMEGFKRLFNTQQPALRLVRNFGMSLMDKLSPIKNHIVMDAMGLRGRLPTLAQRQTRDY